MEGKYQVTCFGLELIIYFWNELDKFVRQISYGESSSHVPSLLVWEAALFCACSKMMWLNWPPCPPVYNLENIFWPCPDSYLSEIKLLPQQAQEILARNQALETLPFCLFPNLSQHKRGEKLLLHLISSSCKLMELAVQRSAILFSETVCSTWEMFPLQGETHSQRAPMRFPWLPLSSCIAAALIVPSPHLCVADYCRRSVVTNWLVAQDFVVANWSHKVLSWSSSAPLPCIQISISPLGLHVASHNHLCAFYWSL